MADGVVKLSIHETYELRKFDGDPPKEGEAKEPVEIVTGERVRVIEVPK